MNKKPVNGAVCLLAAIAIAVCTVTVAGAPPPVTTPEPQTESRSRFPPSPTISRERKYWMRHRSRRTSASLTRTATLAFGSNAAIIKAACDLVAAYDKVNGPLWVAHKGFIRAKVKSKSGAACHRHSLDNLHRDAQAIMDRVYTADNLARHAALLTASHSAVPPTSPAQSSRPPAQLLPIWSRSMQVVQSRSRTWLCKRIYVREDRRAPTWHPGASPRSLRRHQSSERVHDPRGDALMGLFQEA